MSGFEYDGKLWTDAQWAAFYLGSFFSQRELSCPETGAMPPFASSSVRDFWLSLMDVRRRSAIVMRVTSSMRSRSHNRAVGGSDRSSHLGGLAADISCLDATTRWELVREFVLLDLTVGVYSRHLHVQFVGQTISGVQPSLWVGSY